MVLHVTSGLSPPSQPNAEDPGQGLWQCSPVPYTARRTPPAHQYSTPFQLYFGSMSGFSVWDALYAVPTVLPGSRCLAAPSAPVGAPVLRHTIRCRRGPTSLCTGFSSLSAITTSPTALLVTHYRPCPCPFLLTGAPPGLFSTPCVLHILPLPSPTFADSPSPPLPQPSLPLVCPSLLHSPGAWRPRFDDDEHLGVAPAPPYAPPPYHSSRCNSSRSIRTLGLLPRSWKQSKLISGSASPSILLLRPSSISGPLSLGLLPCLLGR